MPSATPAAAIPPAVRRLVWWMVLPLVSTILGAASLALPSVRAWMGKGGIMFAVGIPLVCFVPMFIAIIGMAVAQRRIRAKVIAADGRVCIHCVHDLRGLPDQGLCPECGRPVNAVTDRPRWKRAQMLK